MSIDMPRGGRPLVMAKSIPASRSLATAATARSVRTLSWVTSVPSTSARSSRIDWEWRAMLPFLVGSIGGWFDRSKLLGEECGDRFQVVGGDLVHRLATPDRARDQVAQGLLP